jgi:hypothetical protein
MNKKYLIAGILLIIAASFLLAVQMNFSANKNNSDFIAKKDNAVKMYVFAKTTSFNQSIYFADQNQTKKCKSSPRCTSNTCGICITSSYGVFSAKSIKNTNLYFDIDWVTKDVVTSVKSIKSVSL